MGKFYQELINFEDTAALEQQLNDLLEQPINSVEDLENWLHEQTKLDDAIGEMLMGHYIDFQCKNDDEEAKRKFEHDQQVIQPKLKGVEAKLDQRFYESPFRDQLDPEFYAQFIKRKKNAIELFREENIALEIEEDRLSTKYFEITGSIIINWDGEEKTLSQMQVFTNDSDRAVREKAFHLIQEQLSAVKDELEAIMNELMQIRHKKAENANQANYRDYMFRKYERFDYTPEDCHQLARAVQKYVVPLKDEIEKRHQQEIGVDHYRPWDVNAVPAGQQPLKPFATVEELIQGTSYILNKLDPAFGNLVDTMNERGMLDLESRKAKSPGGFCAPLGVSGLSFIFMNAASNHDDLTTMVHEMGHCIHNFYKTKLPLSDYKNTPMESAELASMSMEFFSMNDWAHFYKDEADFKRAKRDQLEGVVKFLPWGVVVDQFQHWMYENPAHTVEERNAKFMELAKSLSHHYEDWSGYEEQLTNRWRRQLHIFEVPFYYIDYVIAQLGALQMYKQYKENPTATMENYKRALSLGSSKPLPEVYAAAGIKFDFSEEMVKELMEFVKQELDELK